jgi:hypothetical protein
VVSMKTIFFLLLTVALSGTVQAQVRVVEVATQKTVSLIFPLPVRHIDLGSSAIGARVAGPTGRVIFIKGMQPQFAETNLTVITDGDDVYSFSVRYAEEISMYNIVVPSKRPTVQAYAAGILDNGSTNACMRKTKEGITTVLQGIYSKDSVMFFHFHLSNETSLPYEVSAIRFMAINRKRGRRAAKQQVDLLPIAFIGNYKVIPVHGTSSFAVALPKFSITRRKQLQVEILEHSGERLLQLHVPASKMAQATVLPEIQ